MNRWQYWLSGIGALLIVLSIALFLVQPTTAAPPEEVASPQRPFTIMDRL